MEGEDLTSEEDAGNQLKRDYGYVLKKVYKTALMAVRVEAF